MNSAFYQESPASVERIEIVDDLCEVLELMAATSFPDFACIDRTP